MPKPRPSPTIGVVCRGKEEWNDAWERRLVAWQT